MATDSTTTPDAPAPEERKHPGWWNFDEDGQRVAGSFLRLGKGHTTQGDRVFVVLDVEGVGERTVWLHTTVLFSAFQRELGKRPDRALHPGERITITRLGWRDSKEGGRQYMDFRVEFGDAYQPSAAELFGITDAPPPPTLGDPAAQEDDPVDDGIPF
jgi:hypothetical protein